MRKISIFNKFFAVLFAASAALSCSKSLQSSEDAPFINMSVVAEFPQTKTVNDGISTKWSEADQITLVHNPAQGGEFVPEVFTLEEGNIFSGTVTKVESVNDWYAFYPYISSNCNPSEFSFTVNPCQLQLGNDSKAHLAGSGFPLYGEKKGAELSSTLSLTVENILSVADFSIVNKCSGPVTIKSVEFTSSTEIAGPFTGDFTASRPEFSAGEGSGKTVALAIDDPEAIAPGEEGHFFAGILPHTVFSGSTLTIRVTAEVDGCDKVITLKKVLTADCSFKAGKIKTVSLAFDSGSGWEDATFDLENEKVKEFLDDADDEYTDSNYKTVSVVILYSIGGSSCNRLDVPEPVELSWDSSVAGTKTIQVFKDAAMTDLEMQTEGSENSVAILNLVPGTRYWYKVLSQDGSLVRASTFTTSGRRRVIKVSDEYDKYRANNFRDFGGIATTDGRSLKYGKIFRGTCVDEASDEEKEYIKGYLNVGLDVDLRTNSTRYLGDDVDFVNGCYTGKMSEFKVENENGQFKKIFAKIVENLEKGKAAWIHCKVGADRTGYVCILLQAALGVSPKECSIDYELTSFSVACIHPRNSIFQVMCREGLNYILDYEGDTFQEKACNILKGYGVPEEQIESFQREMLE